MGRIRTIKPEFHSHEVLSSLPPETHLLAAALTNYADDEGYFNANPGLVKAGTNPLRQDKTSVADSLRKLEEIDYIRIARLPDGRSLGLIVSFLTHQRVSHPTPSNLRGRFTESYVKPHGSLLPEKELKGKGIEVEGEAGGGAPADAPPPLGTLPLNDGTEHYIRQEDLDRDRALYPAVDVMQAYRAMKGYLLANPQKRKTRTGIRRFMNNWLTKDQDRGGKAEPHGSSQQHRSAAERRRDTGIAAIRSTFPEVFGDRPDRPAAGMDYGFVSEPDRDRRDLQVLEGRLD